MARQSFAAAQHEAINNGFLDLLGEEVSTYEEVQLTDTANTLLIIAAKYVAKLTELIEQRDIASSGGLSDSLGATEVEVSGTVYSIGIEAADYAAFVDEGVDGWAKSRGSRFKFKTRGVDPNSEMVASIKDWLRREGGSARNVKIGISSREIRGKKIADEATQRATSVAYMIKRQGIEPTHFWRDATIYIQDVARQEMGMALRIDIINNLTA
jgi:hypothetical protein